MTGKMKNATTSAVTSFNPLAAASDSEAGGLERRRGESSAEALREASAGLVVLFAALLTLCLLAPARAEFANPRGVAIIVGNADYEHRDVPDVTFAHRDADAFRAYVVDVLGFDPENVIDLRDATRRELFDALGTKRDPRSLLWSYLDPDGGSDVVVFYSGHGVPGVNDGRGYLLPVDADPRAAEDDGYPIDLLYRNVGGLAGASSVRVYLDACFSGGSHEGGLIRNASPVFVEAALPDGVGDKVTSLAAASGKQVASWDENARHGLFTHHLLDALYGGGDADGDGKVTAAEAKRYLDRHMTRAARRQHRRIQHASLVGAADAVLATAAAGGAFPDRARLDAPDSAGSGPGAVSDGPGSGSGTSPLPSRVPMGKDETGMAASREEAPLPPVETSEAEEAALGLKREDRLLVQHGLALLGHDIGAVDGVFGPRTRSGIRNYQKEKGLPETGHLTSEQAAGLAALGERRRDEARGAEETRLAEAEAERRVAERQADDEAFAGAKRLDTVSSYREYLSRGGRHAVEARRLLTEKEASVRIARKWPTGKKFRDCASCPEMVVVPAGSFMMGPPSDSGSSNAGSARRVRIAKPFAVGVYEVTRGQWTRFVRATGYSAEDDDCKMWESGGEKQYDWRNPGYPQTDTHPVVCTGWEGARAYVDWLSRETGEGYRLLSESEWEYVARAGTRTRYWWGSSPGRNRANCDGCGSRWDDKGTAPVGSFPPNGFGLHDVHGNVWEWVEDCWHVDYAGAPTDGSARTRSGGCSRHVARGGSSTNDPNFMDVTNHTAMTLMNKFNLFGFRVARALD